jgi:CubicO group peptidase (beta-lactamase class C family)
MGGRFGGYTVEECRRSSICEAPASVTVGGSVELEIAAGPADAEHGSLPTPQTHFQIASVSKKFVAAAHLLLADCGVVDLDASIAQWFPRCSPSWRAIKIRHLLTHTSGLGH